LSAWLTDMPTSALLIWRDRLGYTQGFATRLAAVHDLLRQEHVQLDGRTRRSCDSPEGMRLAVEKASEIHERGDKLAHETPDCSLPSFASIGIFHIGVITFSQCWSACSFLKEIWSTTCHDTMISK
jgi:hypothetical protein